MTESSTAELKAKVDLLEKKMAEEREEFDWDLKAAKESNAGIIRKLEDEITRLKKDGAAVNRGAGDPAEIEMLTKRALRSERKVAELQEEVKRALARAEPPAPKDDTVMRQRAESAETERDQLRKDKRALAREVTDKDTALARLQAEFDEKDQKRRDMADELNTLSAAESERDRLSRDMAQQKQASGQMVEQREREAERLKVDLAEARATFTEKLQKGKDKLEKLQTLLVQVGSERDALAEQLGTFREKARTQVTQVPSSEMFEERTQRTSLPLGAEDLEPEAEPAPPEAEPAPPAAGPGEEIFSDLDVAVAEPAPDETLPAVAVEDHGASPEGPASQLSEDAEEEIGLIAPGDTAATLPGEEVNLDPGEMPLPETAAESATVDVPGENVASMRLKSSLLGSNEADRETLLSTIQTSRSPKETKGSGGFLKLVLFGIVLTAIVLGALHFFPVWFGVATDEVVAPEPAPSTKTAEPDPTPATPAPAEQGVDASVVVAAEPDPEAGSADGTEPSPAQPAEASEPTPSAVAASEASEAVETEAANAETDAADGTTAEEPSIAMRKAMGHAFKLLKSKRFVKALRFTKKWVKKHPEDPTFHYLYGRALFYRKKKRAAAVELAKAIEIDPNMADAHYELGGIYLLMKKKQKSCASLSEYVRLAEPGDRRVAGVRRHMKRNRCP